MTRIAAKFEALLSNPNLLPRDRTFAEDLYAYYKQHKRLTSGRRRWLSTLEEKVKVEVKLDVKNIARIDKTILRVAGDNDWAKTFLGSLKEQLESGRELSGRQIEVMEKVEEQYSEASLKIKKTWTDQWDDDKATRAQICAEYYMSTGYYTNLAGEILNNSDFVPTQKQYQSMTQNKYAEKVLAAAFSEPKYTIGSAVVFRSVTRLPARHRGKEALVIKSGGTVRSATKGAKPYLVLPYGAVTPIPCEERDLKNAPKRSQKRSR